MVVCTYKQGNLTSSEAEEESIRQNDEMKKGEIPKAQEKKEKKKC